MKRAERDWRPTSALTTKHPVSEECIMAGSQRTYRKWTAEEDSIIRHDAIRIGARAIAEQLRRTVTAVYARLQYLGVKIGFDRLKRSEVRNCKQCGAEFHVVPSANQKYCTLKCAYASKERIVEKPKERGFRTCSHCKETWRVTTRNKRRINYCSNACRLEALPRTMATVSRNCIICGMLFQTRAAEPRKTCSGECQTARMSEVTLKRHLESPSSSPQYSNRKAGRRADLGNQYFRSAWEANYARYLNVLIAIGEVKSWQHEPRVFLFPNKRGVRSYRPDFEVVVADGSIEYHEVKGYDHPRGKLCRMEMNRHYPNEKLVLIGQCEYEPIAIAFCRVISGWE